MRLKSVILFALLLISPTILFADFCIVVSEVNVRKGPGRKYSSSFTLSKGDRVELILKTGKWHKIKYLDKTGYVYSKFLARQKEVSPKYQRSFVKDLASFFFIPGFIFLIYCSFILFRKVRDKRLIESVTQRHRGNKSERDLVLKLLKFGIPAQDIFHDLYIQKNQNEFSQIDLIAVTDVGIIAFEVKDYSGWIFGTGNQSRWTKSYGRQKYYFYNPIKQNQAHISELKKKLEHNNFIPIFSVVVFYGSCELKSINYIPNGTLIVKSARIIDAIKDIIQNNPDIQNLDKVKLAKILAEAVTNGGIIENRTQHSENIDNMLGTHRTFD